jgi:hypothetical protein
MELIARREVIGVDPISWLTRRGQALQDRRQQPTV